MDVMIENNKEQNRFQAKVGNSSAFLEYELTEGTIVLLHTEVPKELEGKGLGSKVVKAALEYAERQDLKVIPTCPFVSRYIEKHDVYEKLVKK